MSETDEIYVIRRTELDELVCGAIEYGRILGAHDIVKRLLESESYEEMKTILESIGWEFAGDGEEV